MRLLLLTTLVWWPGATLLLSMTRWFSRRPLTERLGPFAIGVRTAPSRPGALSVESLRQALAPLAHRLGEHLARAVGVTEDAAVRLARIHSPLDATAFRVRQLGWAVSTVGIAGAVSLATLPPAASAVVTLAAPLLALLAHEQHLARASRQRQRRLLLELPVVGEQIGMLLGAGYSLGGALNRIAARGTGVCAEDLAWVTARVRHGLSDTDALREWAALARVPALDRLVAVLSLHRDTTDLGRLIGEEARSIRREVQRDLVEQMERRAQQVWIPVTVATLVPGVIFLAVPFAQALQLFAGG